MKFQALTKDPNQDCDRRSCSMALNAQGHGIGAIITSPKGFHLPFTARLCFVCTKNTAEYEACIFRIESAIDLRIKILEVYGN